MRKPRFTWISPWSSIQGTRNMITRSGSTRRSMILAGPVFRMALDDKRRRLHHLEDRLMELRLGRVLGLDQGDDLIGVIPHRSLRSPALHRRGHGCANGGSRSMISPEGVARPQGECDGAHRHAGSAPAGPGPRRQGRGQTRPPGPGPAQPGEPWRGPTATATGTARCSGRWSSSARGSSGSSIASMSSRPRTSWSSELVLAGLRHRDRSRPYRRPSLVRPPGPSWGSSPSAWSSC